MADFLSKLSGERVEVVRTLLQAAEGAFHSQIKAAYDREMRSLRETYHYEPDPEAADAYLTSVVERDLLLAFRGYSDWLAALLWRKNKASEAELALPTLTQANIDALADRVDASREMFKWLESHLMKNKVRLPGIGDVVCGRLTVDRRALEQWASCFDWTGNEHSTHR
jgi:hypothetical protein